MIINMNVKRCRRLDGERGMTYWVNLSWWAVDPRWNRSNSHVGVVRDCWRIHTDEYDYGWTPWR